MSVKNVISRIAGDVVLESLGVPMTGVLEAQKEEGDYLVLKVSQEFLDIVYEAIKLPGMEKSSYPAHISVMTDEELNQVGKIKEVGQTFQFVVDCIVSCDPEGWDEMSEVHFIKCRSQDLENLREKYGLSRLMYNSHDFHITVAEVRARKVALAGALPLRLAALVGRVAGFST